MRKNNANVTMDGIYEQYKKSLLTRNQRMYQMSHEQARNNMKEIKEANAEKGKKRAQSAYGTSSLSGAVSARNKDDWLLEEDSDRKIRGVMVTQRGVAQERLKAEVEFFNKAKLKKFLFDKRKKRISDGFLQQFVPPSGDYNTHIKVTWTPSMCLVEHKRNKYRMDDESVDLHKRYSILNNEDSWGMAEQLDNSTLAQIDRLNAGIVQQLFRISNEVHSVRKMVLTLKVDALGKLWFLFFDSLRTSTEDYPEPAKWINYILYNSTNDDDVPEQKPKVNASAHHTHRSHTMSTMHLFDIAGTEARSATSKSAPSTRVTSASAVHQATPALSASAPHANNRPNTSPPKARGTAPNTTEEPSTPVAAAERGTLKRSKPKKKPTATSHAPARRRGSGLAVECPSCGVLFDRQFGIDVSYRVISQHFHLHNDTPQQKEKDTEEPASARNNGSTGGLSPLRDNQKDDSDFGLPMSSDENVLEKNAASGEAEDAEEDENIQIPPILQKLEPTLGPLRYKKLRFNPIWTSKLVKMCESCATTHLQEVVEGSSLHFPENNAAPKKVRISTLRLQQLSRPDSSKVAANKKAKIGRQSATPTEKFRRHIMKPVEQYAKRSRSPYEVHNLRSKTQEAIVQKILRAGKKSGSTLSNQSGISQSEAIEESRYESGGDNSSRGINTARRELLKGLPSSRRTSTNLGSARHRGSASMRPSSTPAGSKRKVPPPDSAARRSFTRAMEYYGGMGPPSTPSATFQRPFLPSTSSPIPRAKSSTPTTVAPSSGMSPLPQQDASMGNPAEMLRELQKEREDLLDSLRRDLQTIDVPEEEIIDSPQDVPLSPVDGLKNDATLSDDRMSPASPLKPTPSVAVEALRSESPTAAVQRSATPGGQSEISFDEAMFDDDDFMEDDMAL